jgi:hypothetical protein
MGIWILIGLERRILWISDCLAGMAIFLTFMIRIRGNTWKKLRKSIEGDDLIVLPVTFIIFLLPDPRKEGIILILLTKETVQALLSLLRKPCFQLKRIPIRPFGATTEPPIV